MLNAWVEGRTADGQCRKRVSVCSSCCKPFLLPKVKTPCFCGNLWRQRGWGQGSQGPALLRRPPTRQPTSVGTGACGRVLRSWAGLKFQSPDPWSHGPRWGRQVPCLSADGDEDRVERGSPWKMHYKDCGTLAQPLGFLTFTATCWGRQCSV